MFKINKPGTDPSNALLFALLKLQAKMMFLVFFLKGEKSCISEKQSPLILGLRFNLWRMPKVLSFHLVGSQKAEQVLLESKYIGLNSDTSLVDSVTLGKLINLSEPQFFEPVK